MAEEYVYMDEDGERVTCDSCDYPAPLAEFYGNHLCALCANTKAGDTVDQAGPDYAVLRAICYVGNAILDRLPPKEHDLAGLP